MLESIFLLIIGIAAMYVGNKTLKHRKRVYSWPLITNGKIISKEIKKAKSGASRGANHVVSIEYEFLLEGKKYIGNHYYALELIGSERAMTYEYAEKIIAGLNDPVAIFYNPENPFESYMIKDNAWFMYFALIVGIIVILISLIGFIMQVPV